MLRVPSSPQFPVQSIFKRKIDFKCNLFHIPDFNSINIVDFLTIYLA